MAIHKHAPVLAAAALLAVACGGGGSSDPDIAVPNVKPDFIKGNIVSTTYDGNSDDLLTAGLGKTGLAGAAPVPANPAAPTAAELRKIGWLRHALRSERRRQRHPHDERGQDRGRGAHRVRR